MKNNTEEIILNLEKKVEENSEKITKIERAIQPNRLPPNTTKKTNETPKPTCYVIGDRHMRYLQE